MSSKRQAGRLALGIDMGGTFTKLALVQESGVVLARTQMRTESNPSAFVKRLVRALSRLELRLGRKAQAVGAGIAGDVDAAQGSLRYSPNLKSFEHFPLRSTLRSLLQRPATVQNDANMAAWGGYVCELRRRFSNVICLTLGTGVGGGIILNGRLHVGSTGSAGEIGHMRVKPEGELCSCGARGCLEAYAGSKGIAQIAGRMLGKNPKTISARTLAQSARRGNSAAREAWQQVGDAVGIAAVNLVYLLNPDVLLFAGGVSRAGDLILRPVRRALNAEPFRVPCGHVRLRIAENPLLGAAGAALFALQSAE